jgi:hypothetical protein
MTLGKGRMKHWISCLITALLAAQVLVSAQAPAARDISGFWELSFDSRNIPRASLLPSVTPQKLAEIAKKDAAAIRWCNILGVPFMMDTGRPLDIRQGATRIILVPEMGNAPRYLYLDRREHIGAEIFDPTTYGDSVARWDGDSLVVDTVGFHPDRGLRSIPGGGYRTDSSHLVERYRLLEDGNVLSVTFTWTDPTVFRTPHTYEFRYYKLPESYEPRTWLPCDPYNESRAQFLERTPVPATGAATR